MQIVFLIFYIFNFPFSLKVGQVFDYFSQFYYQFLIIIQGLHIDLIIIMNNFYVFIMMTFTIYIDGSQYQFGDKYDEIETFNLSKSKIYDVSITPDGNTLIMSSSPKQSIIRIYKFKQNTLVLNQSLTFLEKAELQLIAISNNATYIYCPESITYNVLKIWKYNDNTYQYQPKFQIPSYIPKKYYSDVDLAYDGNLMFASSIVGRYIVVYFYNGTDYQFKQLIDYLRNQTEVELLQSIKVTQDGRYIVLTLQSSIRILTINTTDGQYYQNQTLQFDSSCNLSEATINQNGDYIVFNLNFNISIYKNNGQEFLEVVSIVAPEVAKSSVSISHDGKYIVFTGDKSSYSYYYDNGTLQFLESYGLFKDNVNSVKITPSADFILIGSLDGTGALYSRCKVQFCLECSWKNLCRKCQNFFQVQENYTCVCIKGYSQTNNTCVKCDQLNHYCEKCITQNQCHNCRPGFKYINKSCQCLQPNKISIKNRICISCTPNYCEECDQVDICSKCISGKNKSSIAGCVSCNVEGCLQCGYDNNCTSCVQSLNISSKGECFCEKGKSQSRISKRCVKCEIKQCSQCDQQNKCIQCIGVFFPNDNFECELQYQIILPLISTTVVLSIIIMFLGIKLLRKYMFMDEKIYCESLKSESQYGILNQ